MSRKGSTLPADYFERLYGGDRDPWRFRTSPYERDKYRATLAALSRPRYGRGLEAGCSIGIFTKALAARCDRLLAIDVSENALAQARQACAGIDGIEFRRAALPADLPHGPFDLIVLSEVLYYLSPADLDATADRCLDALRAEGEVLLCHWLGETDYPQSGDEAADRFIAATSGRWRVRFRRREPAYRLDVLGC
ncbi:MAG TPA: class I SAM-dependent methyltransferase [Lichenihabitans sp.]|jgi:SAM-dependent methyltransferase|nr:class I SAM-dependent methyltransferase [Lichenihabitans sp.]